MSPRKESRYDQPPDERFARRERFVRRARESTQDALKSRDMMLGGSAKSIVTIDKVINQLTEKLEEWYAVYFPEFRPLEDRKKFVEAVLVIDRKNMNKAGLVALIGEKNGMDAVEKAGKSLGANLDEKDMRQITTLAESILTLYGLKEEYEVYQNALAKELCPNMSEVAGPEIAAKLVAHVGSLRKLGMMASSTIQVLGAEKALFKHLKNRRIAPPKHGIIFQHARISSSPKAVRGKIARALANKIALAARADAFTKHFIAAGLKADFDKRYKEIMEGYERGKE
ncbi:NOP58 family protein [Candidatus Micrarchaeota archaeon]|nr:NOP58 family protein [Candidatus Micrarchaeota archaeon]